MKGTTNDKPLDVTTALSDIGKIIHIYNIMTHDICLNIC